MPGKIKQGDLVVVSGIPEIEGRACVVIKGSYPSVFFHSKPGVKYSEEKLAVDLMCDGTIYTRIKVDFLFKIVAEQQS